MSSRAKTTKNSFDKAAPHYGHFKNKNLKFSIKKNENELQKRQQKIFC